MNFFKETVILQENETGHYHEFVVVRVHGKTLCRSNMGLVELLPGGKVESDIYQGWHPCANWSEDKLHEAWI
jgi:hypothetical protein